MLSRLVRWGNGYGVRIRKRDVEQLGLRDGAPVEIEVRPIRARGPIDLSRLPTVRDSDPRASQKIKEFLYGGTR